MNTISRQNLETTMRQTLGSLLSTPHWDRSEQEADRMVAYVLESYFALRTYPECQEFAVTHAEPDRMAVLFGYTHGDISIAPL